MAHRSDRQVCMMVAMSKSPPMTGEAIRAAREALGMSREGLADRSQTSHRTIQRIELGYNQPQRATLAAIERALAEAEVAA